MLREYAKVVGFSDGCNRIVEIVSILSVENEAISYDISEEILSLTEKEFGDTDYECIVEVSFKYCQSNHPLDPEEWDFELLGLEIKGVSQEKPNENTKNNSEDV